MASSGSSKDLTKALNGFLQAPSLPLPDELRAIIASYLEKHERPDYSAADRLNDELLSIYKKNVEGRTDKYAAFLAIIRELRPAIRTPARLFEWWDRLLDPIMDCVGRERGLASEVLENTFDLLSMDNESQESLDLGPTGLAPFVHRLLNTWMDARASQSFIDVPSVDFKERIVGEALMAFGKKDPKGFMTCLDSYVVRRDYRNSALSLLCDFVQSQPPHLHVVLQTPLFVNILHSLQMDESTGTVTLALVALIMLLPFMPSSLVPYLPTLFNIYARLLFWDRDTYFAKEHTEIGIEHEGSKTSISWEKCLLDPDHDGSSIPYLSGYFTILYGLYPINFVDYIRKPERYLRHANNAEDIDVQAMEIRDRSERFRKLHLLHPNFYNLTIESEKTDLSRWLKSEADEVLTSCMALSIQPDLGSASILNPGQLADPPGSFITEGVERDGQHFTLLGGSTSGDAISLKDSLSGKQGASGEIQGGGPVCKSGRMSPQSTHPSVRESTDSRTRNIGDDSPTLPPQIIHSSSHTQLQDLIQSNKAIRSGLNQSLANDSVPSLVLSPQDSGEKSSAQQTRPQASPNSAAPATDSSDHVALLYHQSLLLRNDLQFERYIKQQHITHMGALRRKQIREAATEAETQNLVMANRSLKQRMDEAKRGEIQIKKEFDHRRNMAKKWETDLSTKLRALREEQKKWATDRNALQQELDRTQAECARLRRVVDDAEEKRLLSEQSLESIDISTDEIERLKAEITRLSASERAFQGKELRMLKAMQDAEAAEIRADQLSEQLAARDDELREATRQHALQIADLGTKLSKAVRDSQGKRASDVVSVYESALAASRTKQAELQKQYDLLNRKYTAAKSALLDIQCDVAERRGAAGNDGGPGTAFFDGDSELTATTGSPISIRNRSQRGFSDPEIFEGVSHNATPPLEPISSSAGTVIAMRPSTPVLGDAGPVGGAGKTSTSPQSERYHGRGGVQNAIKKERKEKKEDKGDKKEKKSSAGLRGIRGFV
ncbi:Hamartin protein-domain-containing protein [Cercophora scortea]|uniref:Hamartin protein-domain-containing protein n=1 Tax=Cercophora scortea TaxID=314031 RepID=A0AAE0MA27_9PEZI|nr:Hamartin protein-domain-containing protein [Cercophora scortea]